MRGVEALVKPALLVWARESAGFTVEEAAKKIAVKPARLIEWEGGESRPTISQLRKVATAYKRPLAVFYLSKPPKDFQAMHDFRRLPGRVAGQESPAVRWEIRKARYRRQIALDLMSMLGASPPRFQLQGRAVDSPEALAQKARTALGVTLEQQFGWKSLYDAFNHWRGAVEDLGTLVFQASGIDVKEMRGFSIGNRPLPVIVVNVKDHPNGRIFSMLHELCHLILKREGLCDLVEESTRPPEEQRVEVFCNQFAAAVLMPRDAVLGEDLLRQRRVEDWTDQELIGIARKYRVSREAFLRRLLVLGRTTSSYYQHKRKQLLEEYERRGATKTEGFPPPDRKAVSYAGHAFVRLVLDGFYQEKITSSDVSDYLEVKLKWMPKIEQAVLGGTQGVIVA